MGDRLDSSALGDPFELWCGFCGAKKAFMQAQWTSFWIVPPCPRCGEHDWRTEVDELTAPDHKELPDD